MSTAILDTNISEEKLVDMAVNGDLDAFNLLVEAYQDIAFHHAWTYLNDRDLAEDATQESFIKAYLAIDRFRKGSFKAWLLRIVTNTAYDALRRNKRQKIFPLFPESDDGSVNDNPTWLEDPAPSIEDILETRDSKAEIYRLIQELPEIYREVLTLVDIFEFEYKEAAQILDIK
ncbi:MAG: RNA polymerase sigma factor, partial [Anaerolineales bacterium]